MGEDLRYDIPIGEINGLNASGEGLKFSSCEHRAINVGKGTKRGKNQRRDSNWVWETVSGFTRGRSCP